MTMFEQMNWRVWSSSVDWMLYKAASAHHTVICYNVKSILQILVTAFHQCNYQSAVLNKITIFCLCVVLYSIPERCGASWL